MLELKNIRKEFVSDSLRNYFYSKESRINKVLNDVSFNLENREILGITGINGSGKSTILRIISETITPEAGEIIFYNGGSERISMINSNERSFYWRLTSEQNLKFFGTLYGIDKEHLKEKIKELTQELSFSEILNKEFMLLSTGQRKKLMIARALLKNPNIILCDEVTSNLDIQNKEHILNYLNKIVSETNTSIIWVSHSEDELNTFCHRILKLEDGNLR